MKEDLQKLGASPLPSAVSVGKEAGGESGKISSGPGPCRWSRRVAAFSSLPAPHSPKCPSVTSPLLSDITMTTVEGDCSAVFSPARRLVWGLWCVAHLQPVVGEQCFPHWYYRFPRAPRHFVLSWGDQVTAQPAHWPSRSNRKHNQVMELSLL